MRSKGHITLVATLGVAASLLPGRRMTHSRFQLQIHFDERKQSAIAKQIIWDKASIANRLFIEALDEMLCDIAGNSENFGGKTVVFGGDFRQTIPIVVGASREEIIDTSFVNSSLWHSVVKIHLHENMSAKEDPLFIDFLLRTDDGSEPYIRDGSIIRISSHMCISFIDTETFPSAMILNVFPLFQDFLTNPFAVINRAILTPKNDSVTEINNMLIEKFPRTTVEYVSYDITKNVLQRGQYTDFLNSLDVSSLSPYL